MAIDKDGRLYIFELKVWESRSENLLQVLRYGQIYGGYTYDDLQRLYAKFDNTGRSLLDVHYARFENELKKDDFNQAQVFVVITNGLDFKTREAVQYWRKQNLDVRPWIYRVYQGNKNDELLLEVSTFAIKDNPYGDIIEGYYILNTNYRNDPTDHEDMLTKKKAAAYFNPWKYKIERLSKEDVVFLYQSGVGIVAVGKASGRLEKRFYQGNPQHPDEEYSMPLKHFKLLRHPISAAEIKEVTGVKYPFMGTMFAIDAESGNKLYAYVLGRDKKVQR